MTTLAEYSRAPATTSQLYLVQFLLLNVDEHVGVGAVAGSHHLLALAAEVVVDRLLLGTSGHLHVGT